MGGCALALLREVLWRFLFGGGDREDGLVLLLGLDGISYGVEGCISVGCFPSPGEVGEGGKGKGFGSWVMLFFKVYVYSSPR